MKNIIPTTRELKAWLGFVLLFGIIGVIIGDSYDHALAELSQWSGMVVGALLGLFVVMADRRRDRDGNED